MFAVDLGLDNILSPPRIFFFDDHEVFFFVFAFGYGSSLLVLSPPSPQASVWGYRTGSDFICLENRFWKVDD